MRIAFRVDASTRTGIGHLKRCLALAHAIRGLDGQVVFVTRELGIDSGSMIEGEGFHALRLPPPGPDSQAVPQPDDPKHAAWAGVPQQLDVDQTCAALESAPPDWVVVDHYAFDGRWHRQAASRTGARICVIDDLADRTLLADMLVDHNADPDHRAKYAAQAKDVARLLGGARFALLSPGYADAAPYEFSSQVRSIGIFMGGTDVMQASALALRACRDGAGFSGPIEIATTGANPHLKELTSLCQLSGATRLVLDQPDLSAFFALHDLQIGAGGGASWERCRIGVPTLALVCADNQVRVVEALAAQGIVRTPRETTIQAVGEAIAQLLQDAEARRRLSENSRRLVDGRGAERVALALLADSMTLRRATTSDALLAHGWRNDESTRRYFRNPGEVSAEHHLAWWSSSLADPARRLLVAEISRRPVGVYRLDVVADTAEISMYLDHALRGIGLGSAVLRAGQRWTSSHEPALSRLVAQVHACNRSSAAAFGSAGFSRVDELMWVWEAHA